MAQLQNKAGQYVSPGGDGGPTALGSVNLPPDLRAWVTDPDAAKAYPITTYTWMLFYKENRTPRWTRPTSSAPEAFPLDSYRHPGGS